MGNKIIPTMLKGKCHSILRGIQPCMDLESIALQKELLLLFLEI